uniref:Uncharacterized protein n=2 Tax=Bursaphelenchus xylophilus TaxID=6326 RepID=A0A1I7SK79_BURXY
MKLCEDECRYESLAECQRCLTVARLENDSSQPSDDIIEHVLKTHKIGRNSNSKGLEVALHAKRINERDLNDLLRNTWVG